MSTVVPFPQPSSGPAGTPEASGDASGQEPGEGRKPLLFVEPPVSFGPASSHVPRSARAWGYAASRRTPIGLQGDGEAEIHNIYLITVWAALSTRWSWKAGGVVAFGVTLMVLQVAVLLNLAWILNDERRQDLTDAQENYLVFTNTDYIPPEEEEISPPIVHKHIVSQDDRYCRPADASPDDPIDYMYYTCMLQGTMTAWDLATLLLMCLAMFEKVSDSSLELVFQVVLGTVGAQELRVGWLRRAGVVTLLTARILQETLFLAISVTIVAAAKGTLQMILNSLAISFFADLDNIVWDRLLILAPSLTPLKLEAEGDLAGKYAQVTRHVQSSRVLSMRYAAAITLLYFFCTIALKDKTIYLYLALQSAPDTNLSTGLFIFQLIIMFWLLILTCAPIGEWTLAAMRSDFVMPGFWASTLRPGKTHLMLLHTCSTATALLFYAIGLVEAVIGARCSWRFSLIHAAIMTLPVVLSHLALELHLRSSRRAVRRATGVAVCALSAVVFAYAIFVTMAPTESSYSGSYKGPGTQEAVSTCASSGSVNYRCLVDEALMATNALFQTYCRCGYAAWQPGMNVLTLNLEFCEGQDQVSLDFQRLNPPGDGDDGEGGDWEDSGTGPP